VPVPILTNGSAQSDVYVLDADTGAIADALDEMQFGTWSGRRNEVAGPFTDGTNGLYDVARHVRLRGRGADLGIVPANALADPARDRLIVWDAVGRVRAVDLRGGSLASPNFDLPPTSSVWWAGWTLGVSQDGRTLVGGSVEHGVRSFDVATGEQIAGPRGEYLQVVLSPDDEVFAWSRGEPVGVLDPATLEPLSGPLPASSFGDILNVWFSADAERLAVVSGDRTYRLLDWPSRTPLGDPIAWDAGLPAVWSYPSLSPDGRHLALPGMDGMTVWDLDTDTWLERACALAGRDLTEAEWQQYLGPLGPQQEICT
jgi:WD40 repeat protein